MVMKKRIKKAIKRRVVKKLVKRRISKPIGILKDGARYRFAFGSRVNPRKGRKMFNSRKTIMAFAKKKGFVK